MLILQSTTRVSLAVLLGAFLFSVEAVQQTTNTTAAALTCDVFKNAYPELTFFSNATEYVTINEDFWTAAEWLGPACIFTPNSAELMSFGVKTLVDSDVPFAVRGGGHMPVAGSANIDSGGILLSSANLDQLILSEDHTTVSVGPGNHWVSVYDYLEPYGLSVAGGRMGVVGVPGFLLGGGISFFAGEYGWASANIASYECVLADSSLVNATATNEYSDLFWALRGGGNNFAIVTSFELKTLNVPAVTVGQVHYVGEQTQLRDQFIDAIYGFAHNGSLDEKAAVVPTAGWSALAIDYNSYVFHNSNDTSPPSLANFTGNGGGNTLNASTTTVQYRSMSAWAAEVDEGIYFLHGWFIRFYVISIVADKEAMGVVHDTFFELAGERLPNVTNGAATLAMMPVSRSHIVNGRGDDPAGDPMGIDADRAPYVWLEMTYMYTNEGDTPAIDAFIEDVQTTAAARLAPLGDVTAPYLYVNDADKGQLVFEGYNATNLERLKEIRETYDPDGVFTYQMPGGFKLADVGSPSIF